MTVTTRIFPKKPIIMTRENKIGTMIGTTAVRISRFWSISLASAVREKLDWELFIILKKRILKHTENLDSYFCFVKPKNKQMFCFFNFFFFKLGGDHRREHLRRYLERSLSFDFIYLIKKIFHNILLNISISGEVRSTWRFISFALHFKVSHCPLSCTGAGICYISSIWITILRPNTVLCQIDKSKE